MKPAYKSILKYLIEAMLISFGVFLAIVASEYLASNKMEERINQSIVLITLEMEKNADYMSRAAAYHQHIKDQMDSLSQHLNAEDLEISYYKNQQFKHTNIPGWTGIGIPKLENIVFESCKTGGVFQEMDIETLRLISSAYQHQAFYEEFGKSALDRFIATDSETKTIDMIGNIEFLTHDILNIETSLQKSLSETIIELKNKYPDE